MTILHVVIIILCVVFQAVMFVIDPSGLSGDKSTLQAQLNVRAMLREQFPSRPWIDVVSKGKNNQRIRLKIAFL